MKRKTFYPDLRRFSWQAETFQRTARCEIHTNFHRVDAMDSAYGFQQFAVGASKTATPECAAGSITQVNVLGHPPSSQEIMRVLCRALHEMPVVDMLDVAAGSQVWADGIRWQSAVI